VEIDIENLPEYARAFRDKDKSYYVRAVNRSDNTIYVIQSLTNAEIDDIKAKLGTCQFEEYTCKNINRVYLNVFNLIEFLKNYVFRDITAKNKVRELLSMLSDFDCLINLFDNNTALSSIRVEALVEQVFKPYMESAIILSTFYDMVHTKKQKSSSDEEDETDEVMKNIEYGKPSTDGTISKEKS